MSDLLKKAKDCEVFLSLVPPEAGGHPGNTDDGRYRAWLRAVYDDPDFLYDGDYFECYERCRDKTPADMTDNEVRGCITFLLRQMRSQYAPYPCLISGELHGLLVRWIELNDKGEAE